MTTAPANLTSGSPGQGPGRAPGPSEAFDARPVRSPAAYPRAGMAMRFHVSLDESDTNLGMWSSCHGLQVQFTSKEITEGGQYCDRTLLPERVEYSTVTLERMMTQADSPRLQAWLARVAAQWTGYEYDNGTAGAYPGQNVTIRLFDHQGLLVTAWVLQHAVPKEWTGPDLDARSNSVALEKLSFDHTGFLRHDAPVGVAP
ncbi:phage tail protein [Streptomyces cadmiisoli]|uniref:phage tail protein n=1 Tax=Streptomyces cadmiisoli TaxID=2184053 RepID=UPI00365CF966